jgi:hypothetical protein
LKTPDLNHPFALIGLPIRLSFLLALTVFLVSGCINVAVKDTRGPNVAGSDDESFAEFMDVPYPGTMTLEKKRVRVYTRRQVLSGVVSVVGDFTPDEIGAFYDQHLPSHGWTPLAEVEGSEPKLISIWSKGSKVLTIIVSSTLAIGGRIRVELWVAPPRLKEDLGKRVIYKSSTKPENREEKFSTTPIRKSKGKVSEENI